MIEIQREKTSSKGNQDKWFQDGLWYKADGLGYEALAEVVVSHLLQKSNIDHVVEYTFEKIAEKEKIRYGCVSANFLNEEDDKLVSVERLFQNYRGESAARAIWGFDEVIDRILFLESMVRGITGIEDFGQYLKEVLTIDALFLNEDRHFHNLAVIQKKDGTFRKCPIFDNGAALLSDVRGDYPLSLDVQKCFEIIKAKPFSEDFDRQLDACELAFPGKRIQFGFSLQDGMEVLNEFRGIYDTAVLNRVEEILRIQIRKYAYLF